MATKLGEVYKCEACGNIVIVVHEGAGALVCCGEDMKLQVENTVDAAYEKHIPVLEKSGDEVVVKIGGVPHPMEEKHSIEWVELLVGNTVFSKLFKPGDAPEARFCVRGASGEMSARAYCNLHGLWGGK